MLVVAAAGAGKTTAVTQYVADAGRPVAWLSLDGGDCRQGRFVTYLAAALEHPRSRARRRRARAAGGRAAAGRLRGMLAEGLPAGSIVVLDDVHEIEAGASALRALRAFLRFVPA